MARSRKKIAMGGVASGYTSSDETFPKTQRKVQRKRYRRQLKTTVDKFSKDPKFLVDSEAVVDRKPERPKCMGCIFCAEICKRPVHELKYSYISKEEQAELDRFEKKKQLPILRRYRRTMFK